ncbi:QueT transporter family protein [Lacticigenium naphthae]|uniref:QueT transporter family protein n=1 Tax=Lacticigenium naphthae TaxID=515351 RepID=UPI0004219B4B|nr:QueT transporter family protein [Lacticigenium naphthae]
MKTKQWVYNALVAALYVTVTGVLTPISFGVIQFRVAEIFNHLAVFNKKYIVGVVLGVFISNLFFSQIVLFDLVFGVGHTLFSFGLLAIFSSKQMSLKLRMTINTLSFAIGSFLIAWELYLALEFPFWLSYLSVAIGELVVMGLGVPLMLYINSKLHFSKIMEK